MSDWWEGFLIGGATVAAVMVVYLLLAIAAMTMWRVWWAAPRKEAD
jgi:hypothetical protein